MSNDIRILPKHIQTPLLYVFSFLVVPIVVAMTMLGLWHWDLTVPLIYSGSDDVQALIHTKVLLDTGWVLNYPNLGAPGLAEWHFNPDAQTSALHSIWMLLLSPFCTDAVQVQQIYYLLNFPLICWLTYISCRFFDIPRIPAWCAGILFAFTTARINNLFFTYLVNCNEIPIAVVAVIWIFKGKFNLSDGNSVVWYRNKYYYIGLAGVCIAAVSDGYYAFFTLLMLGFATGLRLISGEYKNIKNLIPAVTYITSLMILSLALQWPIIEYKHAHPDEFKIDGQVDPALVKHPFEAEVYSSSLKMMIAPASNHRFEALRKLGTDIIATSDAAKKFPKYGSYAPLGILCSILLFISFTHLVLPKFRPVPSDTVCYKDNNPINAILALVLFTFLCSISGGLGTIIALVFPTIRAYERYVVILQFLLFMYGAYFAGLWINKRYTTNHLLKISILFCVTTLAVVDQVPAHTGIASDYTKQQFTSERSFIRKVESELPVGAMVYQIPYSQYLDNGKYYGHGSFAHMRFYISSSHLRWSNGASKNAPVESWQRLVSNLPLEDLLSEIRSVGFKGVLIDRYYMPEQEYAILANKLRNMGYVLDEEKISKLTFFKLPPAPLLITYNDKFDKIKSAQVTDVVALKNYNFPPLVNKEKLLELLNHDNSISEHEISVDKYPEAFHDNNKLIYGFGLKPYKNINKIDVKLSCNVSSEKTGQYLNLSIMNNSLLDYYFDLGPYHWSFGYHIRTSDGKYPVYDSGFRFPINSYLKSGLKLERKFSLNSIPGLQLYQNSNYTFEVMMVQDANAWLNQVVCETKI